MPRAALLTLLLLTTACTASRALEALPRRPIDRPLAMPEGVSTWEPSVLFAVVPGAGDASYYGGVPTLLHFRAGLTDELTLLYSPLPLGIQWQPIRGERHVAAASVVAGFGVGLPGLNAAPRVSFAYRFKLIDAFALTADSTLTGFVPLEGESNWDANARAGALLQLGEDVAITVSLAVESRGLRTSVRDGVGWVWRARGRALVIPVGAEALWSIDRQWDMALAYRANAPVRWEPPIGAHEVTVRFAHFW